jgi:hypothetical protein
VGISWPPAWPPTASESCEEASGPPSRPSGGHCADSPRLRSATASALSAPRPRSPAGWSERLRRERSEQAEEQLERLRRFCRTAHAYEAHAERPSLADFLAQAVLHAADEQDKPGGQVTLSTLHAAKGREWDRVLIAGFCEGLLPHRRALDRGEVDEERRLAYVGMTRARRELALSWPHSPHGRPARPSRFLAEAGLGPGRPAAPVVRRAA